MAGAGMEDIWMRADKTSNFSQVMKFFSFIIISVENEYLNYSIKK